MKRLQNILAQFEEPRILDVATGSGQFLQMLLSVCNHYSEIIGIDTHEKAIERAQSQFDMEGIKFIKEDIFKPTSIGVFDVVTISNSLHHFESMDDLLRHMKGFLKENGIIIINEMINDHQKEAQMTHVMMHHFWAEIDRINGICHKETYSSDYLLNYFKSSPYKLVDTWTLSYDEPQVIKPEDYSWLKGTLKQSIDRIDKSKYPDLLAKKDMLVKRIDEKGFESATQLIFILKNA